MPEEDDDFWSNITKKSESSIPSTENPTETPQTEVQETKAPAKAIDDPFSQQKTTEEPVEETKITPEPKKVDEIKITTVKCGICEKDLDLSTAKSDNGVPVHGECLIKKTQEEIKQQPQTAIDDPFEASITSETVEEESKIETPLSPPDVSPFVDKNQVSQEEEFAKTKSATSGKNISFMIFGKKGTTKTATALSLPGRIFAISMDQQTAIIHEEFFNNDPRIEVWDGIEFFNSKDPETKLETAVKTVEYVNWLLENPCIKFKPDWILIDGTERLSHVCEMAMRSQENLLPYEGVKNRNAWKYRNDLINNVVQRASQIARLGVVYTAFTYIETVTTATGEEKREGPKWAGDIEQKTQIVIKATSAKTQNGRSFALEVESSKVSFIPTGKRIVVGERLNTGEIQNNIGIKGLFTPKGVKKYFSGGEQ